MVLALHGTRAMAQSHAPDFPRSRSDLELYERVLALAAGAVPRSWTIRPARLGTSPVPAWQPWGAAGAGTARPRLVYVLAPVARLGYNSSFPWQVGQGPWTGRGLNARFSFGAGARYRFLTARVEPVFSYAANQSFQLDNPAVGFFDPMRPGSIDQPQRFGSRSLAGLDAGESFARADIGPLALGLSNERVFWGPGVRHAVLLSGAGVGFPHIFAGTNDVVSTPLGDFQGQLLYGRLAQSRWAPAAPSTARFASGIIGSWMPRGHRFEIGAARFYHRAWPTNFRAGDLLTPFGSLLYDAQTFGGGIPDNQLASLFFAARAPRAHLEVFGEFARNDRSAGVRDLFVELEHNSAWLLGFLKSFAIDSSARSMWSARLEVANGRIPALQTRTRGQSTFYEHSPITQGHTQAGQLLGTLLIDRSGGAEFGLDRWTPAGRFGIVILERQMPADDQVGMSAARARSQWDVSFETLRFTASGDFTLRVGYVRDMNRFPGRDGGNLHFLVGYSPKLRGNLPWR